jgi:CHAT domain-containing protein/tetratricopeptide (TPR) repeat protein
MLAVMVAHAAMRPAFQALVLDQFGTSVSSNQTKRALHRDYREKAMHLLERMQQHNASGLAPTDWDLTSVAQPLVQQSLMEADVLDALGEPTEASALREWVVALATHHLHDGQLARVQREVAVQRAASGRFNEALTQLDDLRKGFARAGDVVQAAQTTLDLSNLLRWLGDHERSLSAIEEARVLVAPRLIGHAPGVGDVTSAFEAETAAIFAGEGATGASDEAAALWRISVELIEHEALVHKALGQFEEAERLFTALLPHAAALGIGPAINYQLAAIECEQGRHADAGRRIQGIEPAFNDGVYRRRLSGLRLLQSQVAFGLHDASSALRLAEEGVADLRAYPDEDMGWRLQWRRAQALEALGRLEAALGAYEAATASIDMLRIAPLGYRLDSTALEAKLPLFEAAIALASRTHAATACLRFIELVKARGLSSVLSIPGKARNTRTEFEIEFDAVTLRLDALEYQGYAGIAAGADVERERRVLLERRLELMEQVRLREPRWRGLTAPPPFDPAALAARLRERNQGALTLHMCGTRVTSVLVFNGHTETGTCALSAATVSILEEYARNLIVPNQDAFGLDPGDLHLDASMLVPEELLEKAVAGDSLIVAPHGQLHLLPWSALPFGGKRLFEWTAVGMIPNLTCALGFDALKSPTPRAALAGISNYPGLSQVESLPGTALELEELAALYAGRLVGPPLIDASATKAAVRTLAARDDADGAILHVACHGTLSLEDPQGSGVLLVDGKIDAAEWAAMAIHYDEVVLSACSTGWRPQAAQGIQLDGDDVLGLPGALLEAGARSVIVSVPKAVDAATAAFMIAYHQRRHHGSPPLVAFRETQREFLSRDFPAYAWSGIVCYGVR